MAGAREVEDDRHGGRARTRRAKQDPTRARADRSARRPAEKPAGQFNHALRDYDQAIKLDPKNARIYANRGMVKLRQGKGEDAQTDFNKAMELEPSLKEQIQSITSDQKAAPAVKRQ